MKSQAQTPRITVAIRKRPLSKKELQKGQTDIIKVNSDSSVIVSQSKLKVDMTKYIQQTTFNFDYAFDENSTNEEIYRSSIRPLVQSAFKGAKITCFAYGQTGSGKTFTMKGDLSKGVPGLYLLGAKDIFTILQKNQFKHLQVLVTFYEIYCGKLFDLFNNRNQLKIREDNKANINVIGMEEKLITNAQQFMDLIQYGSNFRVTSQNASNSQSSRSHAILQITLKDAKKIFSKISFIDLAGNQRGADHMDQNKQTRIDGAEINKSLLSLKECIRALDQGKTHTPFRGSKLTMVLKDSFVGFCKTIMIGNVSPNLSSSENTINTLRYADRVKELKKPSQNTIMTKQEALAKQLMLPRNYKNVIKINVDNGDDQEDIQAKKDYARKMQPQINLKQNYKKIQKMEIEQDSIIQLRKIKTQDVTNNDMKKYQQNIERKSMNFGKNQSKDNTRLSQSLQHQGFQNRLGKPLSKITQPPNNNSFKNINQHFNHKEIEFDENNSTLPNNQSQTSYNNYTKINDIRPKFGQYSNSNTNIQLNSHQYQQNSHQFQQNSHQYQQNSHQFQQNTNPFQQNNHNFNNGISFNHPIKYNNATITFNNSQQYNVPQQSFNNNNPIHYPLHYNNQIQTNYNQQNHYNNFAFNNHTNNQQLISQNYQQKQLEAAQKLQEELMRDFDFFMCEHSNLLQQQTSLIRNEMQWISGSVEAKEYIRIVQSNLDRKLGLLTSFRTKLSFLRDRIQQSEEISEHIGHNDEQLLDELPGHQLINKLF